MTSALVLLVVVQGQAGVFPAQTVSPMLVGAAGNVAATSRLGAIHLNPANAALARGVEVGMVSYPQTELEGASVVLAGGRTVGVVLGAWSFGVRNLIDPDLVAIDPSLGELRASAVGVTSGVAVRRGALGVGVLATYRAQSIVGARSDASSLSAGLRLDLHPLEIGAALIDLPLVADRDISPERAVVSGVGGNLTIGGSIHTRIEIDAYVPGGRIAEARFGASNTIRVAAFEVVTGSSPISGWGVGSAISWQRWRVEAATNLRSNGLPNQHVAISITYR